MASEDPTTNEEWAQVISEAQQYIDQAKKADDPLLSSSKSQDDTNIKITEAELARTIDHTLLKLDATPDQITQLCKEAKYYNFATVCVRQNYVKQAISDLGSSSTTKVACVIGFHEGTQSTQQKSSEAKAAIDSGASELDLVLNRTRLLNQDYDKIYSELSTIRKSAPPPMLLKLILETSQLSEDQIIAACVLASYADFDFVKTSTGFEGRGASVEDVKLMSAMCKYMYLQKGPAAGDNKRKKMEVKASGGIRSYENAIRMIEAGASRLGTSGGVKIMEEARNGTKGSEREEAKAGNDATY